MNEQMKLSIALWTEKSKKLLERIKLLLNDIGYTGTEFQEEFCNNNKPISLVFAGQYSSGKSSIVKALTGINNIAIGADITTQEAHPYGWKGFEVIDTPGIGTTLYPEHDTNSYEAIAKADMLVYVVTQELFDDYIGQNFRKLAIDQDKANEMILIVNKMEMIGNTIENQDIKRKDLEKVTSPYSPEQLRTVFVDVKSYLDSLSQRDKEIADELRERSNFEQLINTLNAFVQEKGFSSRITTVLYEVYELLQKVIGKYQPSTDDNDVDALEALLLQKRRIITDTQWRIKTTAKSIIEKAVSQIRDKGREVANSIGRCDNETDANDMVQAAYQEVETISNFCVNDLVEKIKELSENSNEQLDEFFQSDFTKSLQLRVETMSKTGNSIMSRLLTPSNINQSCSLIMKNTMGANTAATGLKAFSQSNVHEIVLGVGHFFGHSFKPWEAVKLVRSINTTCKILGFFGIVLDFGLQIKETIDEETREQKMRRNRENIRARFNDAANNVESHFTKALSNYLEQYYLPRVNDIDSQVDEIRKLREGKSEACKRLEKIQDDCRSLIKEIHKSTTCSSVD